MNPGLFAVYVALTLLALAGWTTLRPRRTVPPVPAPRRTALYHIPGPGRVLRIGITTNPRAREGQYAREAWWWSQRTGPLTVRRWYPDEAAAHAAEVAAIGREAPIYNIQHNEGRGHALAARRMGLRHVPGSGRRVQGVPQFPGQADGRRVRPDGGVAVPGRGAGTGAGGGAVVAEGVPGRARRTRPARMWE